MNNFVSKTSNLEFKVNQIICLEHQHECLYGEVIQLIPQRGLCWFRPICLVRTKNFATHQSLNSSQLINLRSGSDLLWPTVLFRPAFDLEVISLLAELKNVDESLTDKTPIRQYLNKFIRQVWQENKDKF